MCFLFIWEQTTNCATCSINWLVFITEMKSVYSAVRTVSLNKAVCASVFKGLKNTDCCVYGQNTDYCVYWLLCLRPEHWLLCLRQNTAVSAARTLSAVSTDCCVYGQNTDCCVYWLLCLRPEHWLLCLLTAVSTARTLLCLRPEHWLLCLRPTWKFINSARHPPITFAFLTCYSEQTAHISPNRKRAVLQWRQIVLLQKWTESFG